MRNKENIILADCSEQEVASLKQTLRYKGEEFSVKSHISNWKRSGAISEAKRYIKYFFIGFKYALKHKKIEALVGWQQFYALTFCFFSWLLKLKKTTTVIALNFTYKQKSGRFDKLYRSFMGKCVSTGYLDYMHVLSNDYADLMSSEFGFPRENIIVCPFGTPDLYEQFSVLKTPEGLKKDGYALAIGRSNRDYDFLINSWQNINYKLVVISDTYKGETDNPDIEILRSVAGEDSYPYIANCNPMILPIDDGFICSGDTVLLNAMMIKRNILVTAPSAIADMYIQDGENAVLIDKNADSLKCAMNKVISGELGSLGENARKDFIARFSRESMGKNLTLALQK